MGEHWRRYREMDCALRVAIGVPDVVLVRVFNTRKPEIESGPVAVSPTRTSQIQPRTERESRPERKDPDNTIC